MFISNENKINLVESTGNKAVGGRGEPANHLAKIGKKLARQFEVGKKAKRTSRGLTHVDAEKREVAMDTSVRV